MQREWIEHDGFRCLAGYPSGEFHGAVVVDEADDDHVMIIGPAGVECTCNITTNPNQLDPKHTAAFQACHASVQARALHEIRNDLTSARLRREEAERQRIFGT